jgi:hypothetical protein
MTTIATFSCSIGTTDPSAQLGIEVWLDDEKIFDQEHVTQPQKIHYEFADADAQHELRFVLKNKTDADTVVDDAGDIVEDACLTITEPAFDDIDLGHMFVKQTTYQHDFNGTQALTSQEFYGVMGCNGVVSMPFTTPIYMWLLENM